MKNVTRIESTKIGDVVSIFQRGRVWYAQYQLDGKQHRPSLRTVIKKLAMKKANDLEMELLAEKTPRKFVRVTVSQVIEEFFRIERGVSTQSHYRTAFESFQEFLAIRKLELISQIDLVLMDDFKSDLIAGKFSKRKLQEKTVSFKLGVVRALVLFAVGRKYLESNPLLGLKIKKCKAKRQPFWEWPQVPKILNEAKIEH